jgi:pimeloyl-[acyl-carrier protein] methyl ester esterase
MPIERMLILPGMDGTGKLLLDFVHGLPVPMRKEIPIYLQDVVLSYDQLAQLVRSKCKDSPRFVLMAESFSTPVAVKIAAENPPNLRGLILCAGFARSPVRGAKRWLSAPLAPLLMRFPMWEAMVRSWLVGGDASPELVRKMRKVIASVNATVLTARLQEVLKCDVRSDLRKIAVPMLYLQARQDRLVPARCFEEIRAFRPEMRIVVVDGPHFLLQVKAEQTAGIVTEFLDTLE